MNWVRLYTEIRSDRKIRSLTPGQRWVWIVLLCLARESPEPGKLLYPPDIPITLRDIADESNVDYRITCNAINNFIARKMIVKNGAIYILANWDKRQYESDDVNLRVRSHREKKRYSNVTVTPPDNRLQNTDIKDSKQGETPSPEVKPSSPKKESKPKVETPLAVKIYHRATNLFPAKLWWKILDEAIGDNPDALLLWSRVVTGWLGMGWSPKSVKLMLENFKRRQIPGEKDREWIPADIEPAPVDITEEQAEANRKRLAGMIAGVTARMTV